MTGRFEVPLSGRPPDGGADDRPEPTSNWRRIVAVASLAGVALGILLAIVIAVADDRSGEGSSGAPHPIAPSVTTDAV